MQLFEIFNKLSVGVKALSTKFNDSKHVDPFITSMLSVPSFYFIKPSASVEIPDAETAEVGTKSILKLIHDPKSGKFFEPWYS